MLDSSSLVSHARLKEGKKSDPQLVPSWIFLPPSSTMQGAAAHSEFRAASPTITGVNCMVRKPTAHSPSGRAWLLYSGPVLENSVTFSVAL